MWKSYWDDRVVTIGDVCDYKSRFFTELKRVANSGIVSEYHFFAPVLESQSVKSSVPGFEELRTHQ